MERSFQDFFMETGRKNAFLTHLFHISNTYYTGKQGKTGFPPF